MRILGAQLKSFSSGRAGGIERNDLNQLWIPVALLLAALTDAWIRL
jgi:hypothetical protein